MEELFPEDVLQEVLVDPDDKELFVEEVDSNVVVDLPELVDELFPLLVDFTEEEEEEEEEVDDTSEV